LFDLRGGVRLLLDGSNFRPTTRGEFFGLCYYMIHMKRQRNHCIAHQTAW
jgi:hypothetical protein